MSLTLEQVTESLHKQFNKRYAKKFADLNKNVYPTAKNDKGSFEVPVPVLGAGGGTLITGNEGAFNLNPPAPVSVQFKVMKPQSLVYRISFPYSECDIAANKEEYFNYLFDAILGKAIGNYEKTVGGADKVRFGECYCIYERPGSNGDIFRQLDNTDLELRLYGTWASDNEDYT